MVREGIVLGHRISRRGIEVDRAKIEIIETLPPPTLVKGVRSFLGHAGFYRRFIQDFSKVSKPLSNLLMQGVPFEFNDLCMNAFKLLKKKLISSPIVVAPYWNLPFERMCDVSDFVDGAVLGQRKKRVFYSIYYASQTLNDAQLNYATIEKKLLAIVFAFDKFKPYLICETLRKSNFMKKSKMVISVKIQNFFKSRITKQTSPLELSREI